MPLMLCNGFYNCNLIIYIFDTSTFCSKQYCLCDLGIYGQPFLYSHAPHFFGVYVFSSSSTEKQRQQYLEAQTALPLDPIYVALGDSVYNEID